MAQTLQKAKSSSASRIRRKKGNLQRHLGRGDWLIQQVKSQNGVPADQREALAALGLLKIGRCSLFLGDRVESWGQVEKVQHLVAIRPLTQASPKTSYRFSPDLGRAILKQPVIYDIDGRSARHYDFDGDSFFSIEPYDSSVAINWSTALPIATVIERLSPSFLRAVHTCTVFDPFQKEHRELSRQSWRAELQAGYDEYPFVRLETDGLILAWQRPAYPSHVDEDVSSGRIGITSASVDKKLLDSLIQTTATPPVGSFASELILDAEASLDSVRAS